jgi:hypothetical protein
VTAVVALTFHHGGPSLWRMNPGDLSMLWALIVILVVLWLLGFLVVPIGSGLIHLLLVIALVALIYQLVTGRRTL